MIIKTGEAERFLANAPKSIVAVLFYGPDEGLVRERAERMAKAVVLDLSDPFRVVELSGSALESDPARLFDEAAAISMIGGRRVIRVRDAGNLLAELFERFFVDVVGDGLVVVEAGELQKSSALRRAFKSGKNAAAVACYSDDERALPKIIRDTLKAAGLTIADDAVEYAASRLGADRALTRRELEKLALYAHEIKSVSLDDVRVAMSDKSEIRMEEACDAMGEGDFARLDRMLVRLWASGYSPTPALRQALGHFQRLAVVRGEAEVGGNAFAAMKKLRPPPHFSREKSFLAQVSRWPQPRLDKALHALYEAEALVKTTSVPAEAACGQVMISVCSLTK